MRAERFREFLHLLPNGFCYPDHQHDGVLPQRLSGGLCADSGGQARRHRSHIRPLRDGIRFLLIIFKIATLYSPLKLFAPTAVVFVLLGLGYYALHLRDAGRFTNMSALLLSAAVIVFLIGLVSEQITSLTYRKHD